MRKIFFLAFLTLGLSLMSCAALDALLIPKKPGGQSQAQQGVQSGLDLGVIPSPWGQILLGALNVVQAGYIGIRGKQNATQKQESKSKIEEIEMTISDLMKTLAQQKEESTETATRHRSTITELTKSLSDNLSKALDPTLSPSDSTSPPVESTESVS